MEIFFGEISYFLTGFGGLWHSAWSLQWSYDKIMRFHETLGLMKTREVVFWLKYSIETPKSHFLWDFWRFGLKRLLRRLLIGSIFGFHLWNHTHNSANTRSILTKLLLKIDIYVFYLIIQKFIDNYLKLIKYSRFSGHTHSRTCEIAYIHTLARMPCTAFDSYHL